MRVAGDNIKIEEPSLTINYDDYGPVYAPVVIFIHGFPFNKHMWDMQTEVLKSNYRVITYDIRGFGESQAEGKDFSLDTLTRDLIHLMDKLQIPKAAVCGLALGGSIALNAVDKYPERFTALILSDTHCGPEIKPNKDETLSIIRTIREKGIKFFAEFSLKQYFASTSFVRRKEEVRSARKMIMNTSVSSICNTLMNLKVDDEVCKRLPEIKVPVLIMVGREDEITTPADAQYLHEQIPGSTLKVIEYAGHLPNLENTYEFNQHLRKFMDKVCRMRKLSEPLYLRK
jgi:pimeloyl-ACP methyl ester carboxylesterase